MARNRQNLNIIYISDRMRETLRPIASCALTAVVAPMGYGKTTAVRWFLAEQAKAGAVVLQASIYSDNRSIFWKSVQKAFAAAGLTVLEGYDCPADASGAALLLEDLCAALGGKTPYYLFLDDFHLLGDERVAQFLCRLAYRLPENVYLIVASRNRFLPGEQVVRLGRRRSCASASGPRPGLRWQRLCWTLCRTISGCSLWSSIPPWPPCWKGRTGPCASRVWGLSWPASCPQAGPLPPGWACPPPPPRRSCP